MSPLKKFIWISVGFHVGVLLFFIFSPKFSLPHRESKITMVRLTKGTGETSNPAPFKKAKGMPESTLREQKSVREKTTDKKGSDKKSNTSQVKPKTQPKQPTKTASPKGGVNPKPKSAADKTIDDALARVEEQLKQRQVDQEAAQVKEEGSGQSQYGSLDATPTNLDPALIAYYTELKKRINEQWILLPKEGAEGQALKVVILVQVDAQGNLLATEFETKSSDPSFDLSAMRAVERAAPFPAPPEAIRDEATREGFSIEFSPRSVISN